MHFANASGSGDAAWAAPTGFGTSNFMFVEDNQLFGLADTGFSQPTYTATLADCHTAGRYVARYNTLIATNIGQTHPTGHAGHDRGCRAHEIYGNTVTTTYKAGEQPNFAMEYNNSGPSLVWGNAADGVFKNILYFNVIRKDNGTYSQTATPNGWGYCGTQFNGTGSNWDGNTDGTTGYPCLDQPGRGQGDLLSGNFPTETNAATGTIAGLDERGPMCEWLSTGSIVSELGQGVCVNLASSRIVVTVTTTCIIRNTSCNPERAVAPLVWDRGRGRNVPRTARLASVGGRRDQVVSWNTSSGNSNDGALDICTATEYLDECGVHTYPIPTHWPRNVLPRFSAPSNLRSSQVVILVVCCQMRDPETRACGEPWFDRAWWNAE